MDHPELAARTQFVRPLIAHYQLRFGTAIDMLGAIQRMMPRIPIAAATIGRCYSLIAARGESRLLITTTLSGDTTTRRQRSTHDGWAGARLESPGMAQQRNSYDCGLSLVDGTRALVRRLSQGQWPGHEPLQSCRHGRNRAAATHIQYRKPIHCGLGRSASSRASGTRLKIK